MCSCLLGLASSFFKLLRADFVVAIVIVVVLGVTASVTVTLLLGSFTVGQIWFLTSTNDTRPSPPPLLLLSRFLPLGSQSHPVQLCTIKVRVSFKHSVDHCSALVEGHTLFLSRGNFTYPSNVLHKFPPSVLP
jgi:hypothetical protein